MAIDLGGDRALIETVRVCGHPVGGFDGVWLGGWLYGRSDSYDGVWWLGVVLGLMAAFVRRLMNERPLERLAAETV